ncbi:hypothetical protein [Pyrobaculum aerophilum]|uniref:hypothetical protein n=1 Tax=Pyrobaculum aerophilum TaxID=13773 RepID=UPI002FDB0372
MRLQAVKSILDYLKEAQREKTTDAENVTTDRCRRVPLPEVFALPRRLGKRWGCLSASAFRGRRRGG